ncbi:hypothetical protein C5167_026941 [Papaver somniferum]|nr:hypothetical protein C5167_026941 [Papaver somniferum]
MITVCHILHLCRQTPGYCRRETWPYTLLQIPTSSTESELKSRYEELRAHLRTLLYQIRGASAAIKELDFAMSMYKESLKDKKPEDAGKTTEKGNATAGDGGGDIDDDDLYAARSREFKKLRREIFTVLPQQPHFNPLPKYCPSVRNEMKLGFDMNFVKLTQKLQNLGDDQILSPEEEETISGELANLEEMGYDLMKLKERFELLVRVKTLAKEDESYEEKRKNLEVKINAERGHLEKVQCRIAELKSEKDVLEAKHYNFKSEMASFKSKLGKFVQHGVKNEEDISAAAFSSNSRPLLVANLIELTVKEILVRMN